MGERGPVPNRSEDLARDPSRKGGDRGNITFGELRPVTIPQMDESWHPIAKLLWQSMLNSGQRDFYQDTDWAFGYSLMEDLTRYKEPQLNRFGEEYFKRSGEMLKTIYTAMERLLICEGDRRRVRIELTAPDTGEDDEADDVMESYEAGLATVTPLFKAKS